MSAVEAGVVTAVYVRAVGSPVEGFAAAGDASLFVNDNTDFTSGDQVLVTTEENADGELYFVGSVDDFQGITLTTPLVEDCPEGSWVASYPLQQETRATVRLAESGEVRECVVLHALGDALAEGIRDEESSETVLTFAVSDVRYVFDVVARQTVRDLTNANPGVPPSAPEAPSLSTLAYLDSMKQLRAQITATWPPVTTNVDLSSISDLDHYEVQIKGDTGDWQTYTSTPGDVTIAFIRDREPGSEWSVRLRAVDTSKRASQWSASTTITAATDDIPPSQPSRPTLDSRFGNITITWDGKNHLGAAMEDDLAWVEVHLSTSGGFDPDESTKIDQVIRAASIQWGPAEFDTTYYVKFVAVDTSGNASTASLQQSTDVKPLVDVSNFPDDAMEELYARTAHFITLDADQVTANSAAIGFLETGTIVGGIFEARAGGEFRTNEDPASNGGVRIRDADGIMAWADGGGTPTFVVDRDTGLMSARGGDFHDGTVTGGVVQTDDTGNRIVMRDDASAGVIEFYRGISGESPGYLNPTTVVGTQPGVTLNSGATSTYGIDSEIRLYAGSSGLGLESQMTLDANNVYTTSDMIIGNALLVDTIRTFVGGGIGFGGEALLHVGSIDMDGAIDMDGNSITDVGALGMSGNVDMNSNAINEVSAINNGGGVITMAADIKPNECYLTDIPTNSGGDAVFMNLTSGRLFVHPSALKYKENVRDLDFDVDQFLSLRSVMWDYREDAMPDASAEERSNQPGHIADEAHDLGLTQFVGYKNGEVEAFLGSRMEAYHHVVLQQHHASVAELERHHKELSDVVDDLVGRINQLEGHAA